MVMQLNCRTDERDVRNFIMYNGVQTTRNVYQCDS